MDMQELRKKLNLYICNTGIKAQFIADNCKINKTTLSKFRNNKRNLNFTNYIKLINYFNNIK